MSCYRNGDYKYYNRIQFPQLGNILWRERERERASVNKIEGNYHLIFLLLFASQQLKTHTNKRNKTIFFPYLHLPY